MKKKILLTIILIVSLLLGGCSFGRTQSEEKEDSTDMANLQEQLDSIQTTVKKYMNAPSSSDYIIATTDEITYKLTKLEAGLLIELKNVSDISYESVRLLTVFYDSENNILSNTSQYLDNFLTGKTYMVGIMYPEDQNGSIISYDHCDVQLKALPFKVPVEDFSDKVEILSNKDVDGYVMAKINNHSDRILTSVDSYILYYDQGGNIIGCQQGGIYDILPNSYEMLSYPIAYGIDYIPLEFDHYEIFVTSALTIDDNLSNITLDSEP